MEEFPQLEWFSPRDKLAIADDLIYLVQVAYHGTRFGSFVNSKKDVAASEWEVIGDAGGLFACVFYRRNRPGENWSGIKIQGIGHLGSTTGKNEIIKHVRELLMRPGTWIEARGGLRHVLLTSGVPIVQDELTLQQLFNDERLKMIDKNTYRRKVPLGIVTETVFGKPRLIVHELKKYSHTGKGFVDSDPQFSNREEWRGPHQSKELDMMLAGVKPAAIVEEHNMAKWEPYIKNGTFIAKKYWHSGKVGGTYGYVIAHPGEDYRLNKIIQLLQDNSIPEESYHVKLGRLLGYTKEHIRKFLGATKQFRESQLNELADTPYEYVLTKKLNDVIEYKFEAKGDIIYTVRLMLTSDELEIGFGALIPGQGPTMDITNTGDAFKVFATVREIIRNYLAPFRGRGPQVIVFSGKRTDPSRLKLYDRIASGIPKWIPGYKVSRIEDHEMNRFYELKRVTEHITEQESLPMYYFAYGMNCDPQMMVHHTYCEPVGQGMLNGYHLTFRQFANVERGGTCFGSLWEINEETLSELDMREGYPTMYGRKVVKVRCDGKMYDAIVYLMTPEYAKFAKGVSPSKKYVKQIVRGYEAFSCPIQQIKKALVDSNVTVETRDYQELLNTILREDYEV